MLSMGQVKNSVERNYNKLKLVARNGVHNVKNMPKAELAVMSVFKQQNNR